MSNTQQPLKLGATFFPGGLDDFDMPSPQPDLVSATSHRALPELPAELHEQIGRLELEGRNRPSHDGLALGTSMPFPKLRYRTPNVPPSNEEREATLERARLAVITSTDPEMQLVWARDALAYVDMCVRCEQRLSRFQRPRPSTPPAERQIRVDAMNIVMFLADQLHPAANFLKGNWLEFGKFGWSADKPEAFRCYKRAAAKGYARAYYRMGMLYELTGETVKALQHYKVGEEQGDAASCYRMGMATLSGQLGQRQDYRRGISLISKAAQNADENAPQGAYVYGMLQARELSQVSVPELFLPLNMTGAKMNIEKAAYLGFSKAQQMMGSAYELSMLGCEFNPELSIHYNSLAAAQGDPEAEMSLSKWFLCGHEGLFTRNEDLAYWYAQSAAYSGFPMAEFAMGYYHEIGMSVPVDLYKARAWYEKASKNGNQDARDRLKSLAMSRTLSKNDHETVAISRIRSQHGSRRNHRPERLTKSPQPMPTIADTVSQHSLPSILTQTPSIAHGRSMSASPLSLERRLPQATVPDQPGPVLPYPVDEHFTVRQQLVTANDKPLVESRRPLIITNGRSSLEGPSSRSSSAPRIMTGDAQMQPANRMASGPPVRPNEHVRGPVYNELNKSAPSISHTRPPELWHSQHASLDNPRLEHMTGAQNTNGTSGWSSQHTRVISSDRHNTSEASPTTRPPSNWGPGPRSSSLPGTVGLDSRPTSSPHPTSAALYSGAPAKDARSSPSGATSSGSGMIDQPVQAVPPPTRGPQTFEEMGVPRGKQDQDCIIM